MASHSKLYVYDLRCIKRIINNRINLFLKTVGDTSCICNNSFFLTNLEILKERMKIEALLCQVLITLAATCAFIAVATSQGTENHDRLKGKKPIFRFNIAKAF